MAGYRCPLCGREMERNLILFLDHTDQHIIDQIKEEHREWVGADGVCEPCAEYYRKQLKGELSNANIGPEGRRRRLVLGIAMLAASVVLALIFIFNGWSRPWRLLLFLPIFFGMLGLIQARQKTCALLAELGVCDMDSGERKIDDVAVRSRLKVRGRGILVKSVLSAAALTALILLF